jgi:hypothetical protein
VHTLLREDLFAGFLEKDMKRLARGEKNAELLLSQRPDQKGSVLAWKAGAIVFRAVLAHEAGREAEFQQLYKQALDLFAQAGKEKGAGGVEAILGGTHVLLADRLPAAERPAAWSRAYEAFSALWKQQSGFAPGLPVHLRGELLGGLALSAARTGRTAELNRTLDRMTEMLKGTPYEAAAKKWKADPTAASNPGLTCLSCHEGGRLDAKIAELSKK